jgi:hypothetical protein
MEKILDIVYPIITTYTHHAHLLAILGTNVRTKEWIFSNYIQIYINKDLNKDNWADFYFPMPYEIKPSEICKWIETQKISEELIESKYVDIVKFIIDSINIQNYVHMMINYKYVTNSYFSKENLDKRHDVLVYGFDDVREILYCIDFTFNGSKYMFYECTFEDFRKAYYNYYVKRESSYLNHCIYSYRLKDNCDYVYDIANVVFWLKQYTYSNVPEYWEGFNNENKHNILWGISYYDVLCDNIQKTNNDWIDIRFIYLLKDHNKMMIERLKFIQCNLLLLDEFINIYEIMYNNLCVVINLVIKFNINKDESILLRIASRLRNIKETEYKLLCKLIKKLETIW